MVKVSKRPVDVNGYPTGEYEFVLVESEVLDACALVWDEAGDQTPFSAAPLNAAAGEWLVALPDYLSDSLAEAGGEGYWTNGLPVEYKVDTIFHPGGQGG